MINAVLFALQLPVTTEPPTASTLWQYVNLNRVAAVMLIVGLTGVIIHYLCRLLDLLGSKSSRARFVVRWVQPAVRIFLWFGAFMLSFGCSLRRRLSGPGSPPSASPSAWAPRTSSRICSAAW